MCALQGGLLAAPWLRVTSPAANAGNSVPLSPPPRGEPTLVQVHTRFPGISGLKGDPKTRSFHQYLLMASSSYFAFIVNPQKLNICITSFKCAHVFQLILNDLKWSLRFCTDDTLLEGPSTPSVTENIPVCPQKLEALLTGVRSPGSQLWWA